MLKKRSNLSCNEECECEFVIGGKQQRRTSAGSHFVTALFTRTRTIWLNASLARLCSIESMYSVRSAPPHASHRAPGAIGHPPKIGVTENPDSPMSTSTPVVEPTASAASSASLTMRIEGTCRGVGGRG